MPAVSTASFTVIGRPWRSPSDRPAAAASSAAPASASARSQSTVTTAFSAGLTASTCVRVSASSSRALTTRSASSAVSSVADLVRSDPDRGSSVVVIERSGRAAAAMTTIATVIRVMPASAARSTSAT